MPSEHSTPYVFLSYASADRDRALGIADRLEAAGVPVWIDRRRIEGGTTWSAEIVAGLEGSAAVVVLCSAAAMSSRNVRQEIQLAWESNRPLVPFLLEAVRYPGEVRYHLTGRQWIEVLDQPDEIWLPRALRALAGLGIGADPAAASASLQPSGGEPTVLQPEALPRPDAGPPSADHGPQTTDHGLGPVFNG